MALLRSVAAALLAGACGAAAAASPFVLLPSTLKVRPHESPTQLFSTGAAGTPFEVLTARNEYESFQVAASGAMTIWNVVVDMPYEFTFEVHAIWNYYAAQPSDCTSQPGLWPDALIPVRDVWYHEARAAFPIQLEGPSTGGVWIDVFTPPATWAGNYSGDVVVTYNTTVGVRHTARLPFTMVVADLVLPSVSPRRAYFSYTASSPAFGPNYTVETMGQQYMDLGLMHRISLADAFLASPQLNSVKHLNMAAFDDKWGKYLRGTDTPFGLQDTRVTTFIMPSPICEDNFTMPGNPAVHAQQVYWAKMAQWFRDEGLLDAVELVDYTIDEPSDYWEWQELEARARVVHASDPAIRTLATTSMAQALAAGAASSIDLWVPIIK